MSAFEILLPLALILSLTKLLGLGSQKVGLPAVIGMLIAGLLIGLLKNIHSDAIDYIFFSEDIKEWLSVFAKVGVVPSFLKVLHQLFEIHIHSLSLILEFM